MYEFVLLNMAKEFSDTPGGRYIKDGKFSGEAFRENLLKPKYLEAMNENKRLVILISGCYGLTASFIDESFGKLSKIVEENIFARITFADDPVLGNKIKNMCSE